MNLPERETRRRKRILEHSRPHAKRSVIDRRRYFGVSRIDVLLVREEPIRRRCPCASG